MPRCPVCVTPLTRTNLPIPRFDCSSCLGTWMRQMAMLKWIRQPGSPPGSVADMAALVAETDKSKKIRCPECNVDMIYERYQPLVPLNIDRCPKCQGIWMDGGKANLLWALYHELTTSDDPEVVKRREAMARLGTLDLAMQNEKEHLKQEAQIARQNTSVFRKISLGGPPISPTP